MVEGGRHTENDESPTKLCQGYVEIIWLTCKLIYIGNKGDNKNEKIKMFLVKEVSRKMENKSD